MSLTSPRFGVVHRLRAIGTALITCGLGLLTATSVQAAAPAAGTNIANQATVSYRDTAGVPQLSTSNAVTTQVLQVGAFTLTPTNNAKTAGAGSTVYTAYVLTNTGNGTDTFTIDVKEAATGDSFSKVEVYVDDGSGRPASTTSLCSQTSPIGSCTFTKELGAGAVYKYVVAYTLPTTPWTGSTNTANVTVTPAITSSNPPSLTRSDTVTLTTNAAFQVNKGIAAPTFTPVGVTWPVINSGGTGVTTTYTISYTNTGALKGNLYLKDTLPAGMTYVAGSAYISCSTSTALTDTTGGDASLCNSQGIEYEAASNVIQAYVPNVAPGTSGTLSFKVDIKSTASIGVADTTNTVSYVAGGCTNTTLLACSSGQTLVSSNAAEYTVMATRKVQLNGQDTTPGTPLLTGDTITTANYMLGVPVIQKHTITNNGNVADTFVLKVDPGTYPTGTTFRWFANEAATIPLQSTNSDGFVDTGSMAANASKFVYLQITLPTDTAISTSANYQAVVTAYALNAPTIKDATNAVVTAVGAGWVDLTSTATSSTSSVKGDFGPGPGKDPALTTASAEAGNVVQIPLFLRNNEPTSSGTSITFTLAASSNASFPGTLPAGWSVVYSSTACSSVTPLSNSNEVTVNNTAQATIFACVTSPSTASTQNLPIYFKATAKTVGSAGYAASDILYVAVAVYSTSTYDMSLSSSGINGVLRGTSVDFSHVLVNNGKTTCGASTSGYIKVTAALPQDKIDNGWSTTVYLDADGSGTFTAGDTVLDTKGTLKTGGFAARASIKFLVRISAPGGANVNDTATVTVTVADVDKDGIVLTKPSGCGSITNSNDIKVLAGALSVTKTQGTLAAVSGACPTTFPTMAATNVSVKPGDCVYYEVVANNISATTVTNVTLSDTIPSLTKLASSFTPTCTPVLITGGTPSFSLVNDGNTVSCTSGTTANAMAPLGSLTMKFIVQLDK